MLRRLDWSEVPVIRPPIELPYPLEIHYVAIDSIPTTLYQEWQATIPEGKGALVITVFLKQAIKLREQFESLSIDASSSIQETAATLAQ